MNRKKHSQMSELDSNLFWCYINSSFVFARQRRQFRVFEDLLQLVPGLKDRILNGDPDEVSEIAELVSLPKYHTLFEISHCA